MNRISTFIAHALATASLVCLWPSHLVQADQHESAAGRTFSDCSQCPTMMVVPGGRYTMGTAVGGYEQPEATGESPPVEIDIELAFAIGVSEVTRREFLAFADATDYEPTVTCRIWQNGRWELPANANWRRPFQPNDASADHPVNCVSWQDAVAYAAWLSAETGHAYKLPSEAQWEYAARAGTTAPRWWGWNSFEGVSLSAACDHANVYDISGQEEFAFPWPHARCADRHADVAPVNQFKANPFGLHDPIGNLWEWTQDCFTASYKNRPRDARAWVWEGGCETRVMRGGSWATRPLQSRAANRGHRPPTFASSDVGFRIVRDLTSDESPSDD